MKFTNRRFGVEIEFLSMSRAEVINAVRSEGISCYDEGYNHQDHISHWKLVTDGSCGLELVSPILSGEDGLQQIEKVCKALNSIKAKVDKSCGLHVHVDASDLNAKQVGRVFLAYARHEKLFDALMPESRRANNNGFCHSIAAALNDNMVNEFKKDVFEAYRRRISTRYMKVNLEAYVCHNTIEFRQHSGTTEAEKITNWVVFMVGFVEESILRPITKKPVMHMLVGFKDRYGIKPDSEGRVAVLNDYLNKRLFAMSAITATQKF